MRRAQIILILTGLLMVVFIVLLKTRLLVPLIVRVPAVHGRAYLWCLPVLALMIWALVALWRGATEGSGRPLLALSFLTFVLYVAASVAHPSGFAYPAALALNPASGSYYETARSSGGLWELLRDYDHKMPQFRSHAQTQGAGPVVLYGLMRRLFVALPTTQPTADTLLAVKPGLTAEVLAGSFSKWWQYPISATDVAAALCCSLLVALLGALGVIPAYLAGRELGGSRGATIAAGFYCLTPALTLYTPSVDQTYPLLVALALWFWLRALASSRDGARLHAAAWAAGAGAVLLLGIFLSLGLATLLPLLLLALLVQVLLEGGGFRPALARWWLPVVKLIAVPLLGFVLLWALSGYNLVAVYQTSDRLRMAGYNGAWGRPYWPYVGLNWLEAGATLGPPLLVSFLWAGWGLLRRPRAASTASALLISFLAVMLLLDFSGKIRLETSRLWLFVTPIMGATVGAGLRDEADLKPAGLALLGVMAALYLLATRALLLVWGF